MTGEERLLLDTMLGKLATYLRMCGHDAAYAGDRGIENDDRLLALARAEGRTLVTRDVSLAGRAGGVLLESREVEDQLRELRQAGFRIVLDDEPARCGRCNGPLEAVSADEETPAYAPDPAERRVWCCRTCGQCFWKGSHWDRVAETLADL